MDLPSLLVPAGQAGVEAPVGVEGLAVVGPVVDGEAVVVDGPEGCGQELHVVIAAEGERDVAADAYAGGVHLVGGEVPALAPGMAEALVRTVLPAGDNPLIEEFLELSDGPDSLIGNIRPAARGVPACIARDVLAEQGVNGFECPFNNGLVAAGVGTGWLDGDAQRRAGPQERL